MKEEQQIQSFAQKVKSLQDDFFLQSGFSSLVKHGDASRPFMGL